MSEPARRAAAGRARPPRLVDGRQGLLRDARLDGGAAQGVRARARAPRRRRRARHEPLHYMDPAAFGAACPRRIVYAAKIEAHLLPGAGPAHPLARHALDAARRVRQRRASAHARDRARQRSARDVRRGDAPAQRRPGRGEARRGHDRDSRGRAGDTRPPSTAPSTGTGTSSPSRSPSASRCAFTTIPRSPPGTVRRPRSSWPRSAGCGSSSA